MTITTDDTAMRLKDVASEALVLAGLIEGIDLMGNEGASFDNARIAVTQTANSMARKLADDLDDLERMQREPGGRRDKCGSEREPHSDSCGHRR